MADSAAETEGGRKADPVFGFRIEHLDPDVLAVLHWPSGYLVSFEGAPALGSPSSRAVKPLQRGKTGEP